MPDKLVIEIWSDIACPYCYIGLHKLRKAIDTLGYTNDIQLKWHSYELNPVLDKAPAKVKFYEYIAKMHNESIEDAKKGFLPLIQSAKEIGLSYNLEDLVITNTSDALRLVKLADEFGLATEAEEALFKAYFTDGKCISDHKLLTGLGIEIGIKEEVIKQMLNSDRFLAEIKSDMEYSEDKLKLEYIPFYRINNKIIIQGAITEDEYTKALESAFKEWKNGVQIDDTEFKGQSCSIDGVCS